MKIDCTYNYKAKYLGEYYDEKNQNTNTNQAWADDKQEANICSCKQGSENGPNENRCLLYHFPQVVDVCKCLRTQNECGIILVNCR